MLLKRIGGECAGAQDKLALLYKNSIFYIPINDAPSNFILKPCMLHFQSPLKMNVFV